MLWQELGLILLRLMPQPSGWPALAPKMCAPLDRNSVCRFLLLHQTLIARLQQAVVQELVLTACVLGPPASFQVLESFQLNLTSQRFLFPERQFGLCSQSVLNGRHIGAYERNHKHTLHAR